MSEKYTIKELFLQQYKHNSNEFPYYNDWLKAPYTWLKGQFYMIFSAILVFLLLKTNIKPNTITIIYIFSGILCMILLSIPKEETIIIALVIAFSKGILDWSDGHLARITGQTSQGGHILDIYGGMINELAFYTGLGFYITAHTGRLDFYLLIPLYPLMMASKLIPFSKSVLFDKISSKSVIENVVNDYEISAKSSSENSAILKLKTLLSETLNGRSRSIDLVCLIILLELLYPINISWIIFLILLAKHAFIFLGSVWMFCKGDWAENQIKNKILIINKNLSGVDRINIK